MSIKTALVFVAVAVIALSMTPVEADLPVHCLIDHVVGTWDLALTAGGNSKDVKCSTGSDSYGSGDFGLGKLAPKVVGKARLDLTLPNKAKMIKDGKTVHGTFTMIYDEGWEVRLDNGEVFFAFSDFELATETMDGKAKSMCHHTKPGQFHSFGDPDGKTWGCWTGQKLFGGEEERSLYLESMALVDVKKTGTHKVYNMPGQSAYQSEHELVSHINANPDKFTYKAKVYDEFVDLSMNELHQMGGLKTKGLHKQYVRASRTFKQTLDMRFLAEDSLSHQSVMTGETAKESLGLKLTDDSRIKVDVTHLPKKLDWRNVNGRNFVADAVDQGSCGSCYSVATTNMLAARTRIKYGKLLKESKAFSLAAQKVLSCNQYSQGCAGGFPYLVNKFAYDYGMVEESLMSYEAQNTNCKTQMLNLKQVRASSYGYVGGFYGGCNAQAMMAELMNGPIAIGFQVPPGLYHYESGVYNDHASNPQALTVMTDEHGRKVTVNKWEETNHAVLIVGYDETDDGQPYWIVQNSWGSWWGDSGFFKIARGNDTAAIESMAVWAEPEIVDRRMVAEDSNDSAEAAELTEEDRSMLNMLDLGADAKTTEDEWLTLMD
jgi:cathepsin C